jgi:hypothetical protein
MCFDSIQLFIYNLNNAGVKIWADKNDIRLFVSHKVSLTEDQQNFIKFNKTIILRYLKNNNITSKEYDHLIIRNNAEKQVLSFAQERLWFIQKYEEGTNVYNIPIVLKLNANVKLDILELSIEGIISRHEILRTLIKEDDRGNSYQLVMDDKNYPIEIKKKVLIQNQQKLSQELSNDASYIFDLNNEYPIKLILYTTGTEHYLSIVIHHIAFDGYSVDIFLKELQEYYCFYLDQLNGIESKLNLPDLSIQYKDFALWQRSYLSGNRLEEQLNYWKKKLDGYETLNLISDKPRPSHINYEGRDIYFEIDEDTSKCLREVAKELKVSLYTLLLSGYY